MSAPLAELMTADLFGHLNAVNCPGCHRPPPCGCMSGPPLSPLPDDVVTEPWSWARVTGATATGTVLLLWAFGLAALYLHEWRTA